MPYADHRPDYNGKNADAQNVYLRAYHCSELPFIFNNIEYSAQATGTTPDANALADKMSQAWINFARIDDPIASGLPYWPEFTKEGGATMIFDNHSEVRMHHDDELMKLLAPEYEF
ncbi:MAG: carboxylesterase family protein [Mailhella sp.]|nr:carboxylesterase family protein [Mailhella sp.]MBR4423377.1 carboxylesterase family protein [Mailhella sp.]